jgi:hypothetical protein
MLADLHPNPEQMNKTEHLTEAKACAIIHLVSCSLMFIRTDRKQQTPDPLLDMPDFVEFSLVRASIARVIHRKELCHAIA